MASLFVGCEEFDPKKEICAYERSVACAELRMYMRLLTHSFTPTRPLITQPLLFKHPDGRSEGSGEEKGGEERESVAATLTTSEWLFLDYIEGDGEVERGCKEEEERSLAMSSKVI